MQGRFVSILILASAFVSVSQSAEVAVFSPAASTFRTDVIHTSTALDTAAIHALYMDGEFEAAIKKLELASAAGFLTTHADSVFAYKHLGVMYAARYETMEKGKNFMYRLLSIEPSVKILDMYASEMIYMIFRNIQSEFEIRTARVKAEAADSTPSGLADSTKGSTGKSTRRHRKWPYLTAGALAVAGAGLAAYLFIEGDPPVSRHYEGGP